jgi:hypothetical protein
MSYVLNYSGGRTIIIPPDFINNETSISLPGDEAVDYGQIVDQS